MTFTTRTVVITPAEVQSNLVGVSADGSTYTFSTDSGPFARLAPGKVMLLESLDAADVTSVKHVDGSLVVHTAPVALTDLIRSGTISVRGPPDLAGAFGSEVGTENTAAATSTQTSSDLIRPIAAPYVLDGFTGKGYTFASRSSNFSYSLNLRGASDGVHTSGAFCFSSDGSGSVSGNCTGPLSLEGSVDGSLTYETQAAQVAIAQGKPPKGFLSLSGLSAQLKVNYTAKRDTSGQIAGKLKPFTLPFVFEMPVCPPPGFCGGVPLYMKVEVAILITLGISAKNSTMQGGFQMVLSGSGSVVDQTGFKVIAGSANGFHLSGKFLPGTSITLGASGAEVGLQTKVALGLGIRNLNALFYLSVISAIGQVTGSAVAGQFCSNYTASFSLTGGIEVQLWVFKVPIPSVTLYKRSESLKEPGCG